MRVQDGISPDVSLTVVQVAECLEVCEALFLDGQVFSTASDCYTSMLLQSIFRLAASQVGAPGWPSSMAAADLGAARKYAKTLFKMTKEFLKANFPDYAWRTKFGAFNCGRGAFPENLRIRYIGDLALKEGVNADSARSQFRTALPHLKRLYRETGSERYYPTGPEPPQHAFALFFLGGPPQFSERI